MYVHQEFSRTRVYQLQGRYQPNGQWFVPSNAKGAWAGLIRSENRNFEYDSVEEAMKSLRVARSMRLPEIQRIVKEWRIVMIETIQTLVEMTDA